MHKINGVCLISLDGKTNTIIVKYLFAVLQTTRLCVIALTTLGQSFSLQY